VGREGKEIGIIQDKFDVTGREFEVNHT
jgi:hypothetical protein